MVDDRGSAAPLAAALLLGGALIVMLAVQIGLASASWRDADAAAAAGADAGAARVDHEAARSGTLKLDREAAKLAARQAALAFRPGPGRTVRVTIAGDRVCVTVRQTTDPGLLSSVGARSIRVSARECARPHQG